MATNGSVLAVFVGGAAVAALALTRPAEPRVIYSKTVGTVVEFTGQGQVVPPSPLVVAMWVLLPVVLFAVGAGVVKLHRARRPGRVVERAGGKTASDRAP